MRLLLLSLSPLAEGVCRVLDMLAELGPQWRVVVAAVDDEVSALCRTRSLRCHKIPPHNPAPEDEVLPLGTVASVDCLVGLGVLDPQEPLLVIDEGAQFLEPSGLVSAWNLFAATEAPLLVSVVPAQDNPVQFYQ